MLSLELRFPAVTRAELEAVINAVARTLAQFVPDERLSEAEAFMRDELGLVGLDGTNNSTELVIDVLDKND